MNIQLSDHFTYKKLLRFTLPSIIMMIFTSIYGVVDGLFVSNFVGKTSFAAVNLIMPFLMAFGALGFMVGTGGSAIVSKTIGEGYKEKANRQFSMLIYTTIVGAVILTIIGLIFLKPIAAALGAQGQMLEDCVIYGRIILLSLTAFILQNVFQSFLIAAQKPHLGLTVTVLAGVTNIVLDALFVAVLRWGLVGAAFATAASQIVGGLIPLIYFMTKNKSLLRLVRTKFDGKVIINTCINGSSELMTNISMSIVNILYNFQLMRFAGEDGIAAYGVIMYVNFIFVAVFIGYSIGTAPIISYHYGAAHTDELKNLFRKSLTLIGIFGVILTGLALVLARPLSHIFVGYDEGLLAMTYRGFSLYSIAFLFAGFNIFGSSFFTALNNGLVSAGISFLRTLLFQIAAVLILPMLFKLDGVWTAIIVAELMALIITTACFIKMKSKYHYA